MGTGAGMGALSESFANKLADISGGWGNIPGTLAEKLDSMGIDPEGIALDVGLGTCWNCWNRPVRYRDERDRRSFKYESTKVRR